MAGVIIDIGTGDGSFALRLAKDYPDRYIIGIDPNHQALAKTSLKSNVSESKDRLANLVFVLASIEDLPAVLDGVANQVFINFPWAGLMQKLLSGDAGVWACLSRICQIGAFIEIVISYDPSHDGKIGLPVVDEHYIHGQLAPALQSVGLQVTSFTELSSEDIKNYPSSWGKKLAHGRPRSFYHLRVQRV